jgi:CRP/FNR family transcriptional regulator
VTSASSTAELLSRVPVFSALAAPDLERVALVAVPRTLAAGEVLFQEGDRSDTCYVVRSGRTRAVRDRHGRTITLATFGPHDFFGELAMFEDERRSATVEAIEPTALVAVLGADMRRLMRLHPEITARLVVSLGRRLRQANERLSRQSFQSVQSRVAAALGELAERQAPADDGEIVVRATQADLAQLAGASRESASRFLAVLDRAGVISQGRGRLTIHDSAALARYVI